MLRQWRRGAVLTRVGWISADQAVSSLTNLALSVVVARHVSVDSFGVFALIYASYLFALEFTRALVLEPLIITLAGDREQLKRSAPATLGAALGLAVPMSSAAGVAAAMAPDQLAQGFLILAVALPGLILQDGCRSVLL